MLRHLCALFLVSVMIGCNTVGINTNEKAKLKTDKTSVVIVGVENGYAGKCLGALKDAKNMKTKLSKYTNKVTYLTDKKATASEVLKAISEAVKNDLAIIYFSGHGGSYRFSDTGSEEIDGKDEYICCYDMGVKDNSIWSAITKSKGRVFLIFDCCHSETMFRYPGITLAKPMLLSRGTESINMLCWSGCPDNSYSYGSSSGGKFTNVLRSNSSTSYTYDKAWSRISSNSTLKKYQQVRQTKLGNFDTAKTKIFQ